ncbi:MAG: aryl-sulfate sulfotransferase, partial [Mailhella sp.]|nr:aryl-sulfate sulfotransferase [Mailhella sp.]
LIRGGRIENPVIRFGGIGGVIERLDWDGNVLFHFELNDPVQGVISHNQCVMPNGHIMAIAEQIKPLEEAYAKGRRRDTLKPVMVDGVLHSGISNRRMIEIDEHGDIVWEWDIWDHIGTGPDEFDINWHLPSAAYEIGANCNWLTINGIEYNEATDEIMFTSRNMGEIYIVDRKSGKMVWRWGNPSTHGKGRAPSYGDDGDQKLWGPHNATWVENGNILVFDNGWARPQGQRSRVLQIDRESGEIVWMYEAKRPLNFHSPMQSGAQRLPNGNTLICATAGGQVFEVTGGADPRVVWEFVSPWMMGGEISPFLDDSHALVKAGRTASYPENYMKNFIHRAYRYGNDFPGFAGKTLDEPKHIHPGIQKWWLMEPWKTGYEEAKKRTVTNLAAFSVITDGTADTSNLLKK